ncbi:hypothetical protein CMV30_18635 [Nibricoccus aquaticus]|uniref:Ig-like domain-containing protein n=1 Tax=Nibricoccus aquaticus TaxID=2576891 RepID=A0A290QNC4_9BACT|nr:immunoglobulin domain-containing protein [Nibricoccus aquaticus]ATC65802.1 hypothetical protein CMV30_18635 [Nibricoccus aquaticus]
MKLRYTAFALAALLSMAVNVSAQVNYYANKSPGSADAPSLENKWNLAANTYMWAPAGGASYVDASATPGNVYHTNGYTVRAGRIGTTDGTASSVFLGEKLVVDAFSSTSGLTGASSGSAILLFELAATSTGPRLGVPGSVTQGSYSANIATGTSTTAGTQHLRFSTGVTVLQGTLAANGYTNFSIPNSVTDVLVTIKSAVIGNGDIEVSGGSAGSAVANGWVMWAFEDLRGWTGSTILVQHKHTISFTRDIDFRITNSRAALTFGATSIGFLNLSANVKFDSSKVSWGTNILPDGTYTAAQLNALWKTGGYATLPFASGSGTLTVAPLLPPGISSQPSDQVVSEGGTASFSVTATGEGPFTYEWQKDGFAISNSNSATYAVTNAQMSSAGQYRVKVSNAGGNTLSSAATLTVQPPGFVNITTQPVAQTVIIGGTASFSVVATGDGPFTYEWQRNGQPIANSNSATLSVPNAQSANAGQYRVKVSSSMSSVFSNAVTLTITVAPAPVASGFAATTTGGANGAEVLVTNAADFKAAAESSSASTVTVLGQISLASVGGSVRVASNKTIQGMNGDATIVGCLDLSNGGVTNVVIRGLNITNPGTTPVSGVYPDGGDGIKVRNASKVYITHCTLFNCADELIEISGGSDNITVSWCEFYYTSAQTAHRYAMTIGQAGAETNPMRVTLQGNWWSSLVDQRMPFSSYGYVHQFNNYFNTTGNTSGGVASDGAQFLVERSLYSPMANPLSKQNVNTSLPAGKLRIIDTTFTVSSGTPLDVGTDVVFTPPYSYEMIPTAQVAATTGIQAGNIDGAWTANATSASATITAPTTRLLIGDPFTLTAVPAGFTATSYQWRLNNIEIPGATNITYSVANGFAANAGAYTVALGRAGGNMVVSAPATIFLNSSVPVSNGATTGLAPEVQTQRGGGGSPSLWFLGLLASTTALRVVLSRKKSR